MLLICYDIASDSLRSRVAQKLLEYGLERINRSVFLGAPDERETLELQTLLQGWMTRAGKPDDSLILLPVTARQVQRMLVLGDNQFDVPALTGDLQTVFC